MNNVSFPFFIVTVNNQIMPSILVIHNGLIMNSNSTASFFSKWWFVDLLEFHISRVSSFVEIWIFIISLLKLDTYNIFCFFSNWNEFTFIFFIKYRFHFVYIQWFINLIIEINLLLLLISKILIFLILSNFLFFSRIITIIITINMADKSL